MYVMTIKLPISESVPHIRAHTIAIDKTHLVISFMWMWGLAKQIAAEFTNVLRKALSLIRK